jgi:hypothetical protein
VSSQTDSRPTVSPIRKRIEPKEHSMAKARTYFTLAERNRDGAWAPQFGSYDRADVDQERADWIDSDSYKASDLRVIKSGDMQAEINAAIDKLNADWRNG